jgi:hypothetical protein
MVVWCRGGRSSQSVLFAPVYVFVLEGGIGLGFTMAIHIAWTPFHSPSNPPFSGGGGGGKGWNFYFGIYKTLGELGVFGFFFLYKLKPINFSTVKLVSTRMLKICFVERYLVTLLISLSN